MEPADGVERRLVNTIIKPGGEAYGAQHAQVILAETRFRVADGTNDAIAQIIAPADEIQYFVAVRIEQQGVNGEIPPQDILARVGFEIHSSRMAPIHVGVIAAERGDFYLRAKLPHQNDAEVRTD